MALKDWKKMSDTKFVNKKRKGTLYIFDEKSLLGNSVDIEIDTIKIQRVTFAQTHIHEEFDSKAKAIVSVTECS